MHAFHAHALRQGDPQPRGPSRALFAVACALAAGCGATPPRSPAEVLRRFDDASGAGRLEIVYPFDGSIFPPEIPAPTIRWRDGAVAGARWVVGVVFGGTDEPLAFESSGTSFRMDEAAWTAVKERTVERQAAVCVVALDGRGRAVAAGRVSISTSRDPVGAPLFYREVNLPFVEAVKDPSRIRWRFGAVSATAPPPVVLENLPVCGNCHSFSADGRVLGMDVDYANDKGSYAVLPVEREMVLDAGSIITWSEFRRDDGEPTYGLLSRVSPDGARVASTVKDRSVFVARPDLAFSQLFFPVKGIVAVYTRSTRELRALRGADDPAYVNSNPVWTPDGSAVVFTRAAAHPLRTVRGRVLLSEEECREFLVEGREFKFDLYRVPFAGGDGGEATPVPGASGNGTSNYFPAFSPDGRWLVFCRAANYSLLQPDSALYIMPAAGGQARAMRCNTSRMNSWHSFSPNGRWLVFASKAFSEYTQLFLTHVDDEGNDAPPVVLDRLTASDRAANIPEFVNVREDAVASIAERFVDDESFVRAAQEFVIADDIDRAIEAYRKALAINPSNHKAHLNIAVMLERKREFAEAETHHRRAVGLAPDDVGGWQNLAVFLERSGRSRESIEAHRQILRLVPDDGKAHYNMAVACVAAGDADEAVREYREAIRIDPKDSSAHNNLGTVLQRAGRVQEAEIEFAAAVQHEPGNARAHNNLGTLFMMQGRLADAVFHYREAVALEPAYAQAHSNLGVALQRQGEFERAVWHYREALRLDPHLEQARHNLDVLMRQGARAR